VACVTVRRRRDRAARRPRHAGDRAVFAADRVIHAWITLEMARALIRAQHCERARHATLRYGEVTRKTACTFGTSA